jgi:hypothetical protein
VRRHRGAVAGALLTTLALLAATGVTTWQMLEARAQREEARAQAARSAATQDFLTVMVSEIGADGGAQTPRQMLDRGLNLLNSSPVSEPRFLIGQHVLLGTLYSSIGQTDREATAGPGREPGQACRRRQRPDPGPVRADRRRADHRPTRQGSRAPERSASSCWPASVRR